MNPVDQLLRSAMSRGLGRIAGTCPEGTFAFISAHHPALRGRLEEAEERLAGLRAEILDRHAAWQAALMDLENLWALAALKRAESGAGDALKSAA